MATDRPTIANPGPAYQPTGLSGSYRTASEQQGGPGRGQQQQRHALVEALHQRRRAQQRDATLGMPSLMLPAIQVNMRGGNLPPVEGNGVRYLKIPLDLF